MAQSLRERAASRPQAAPAAKAKAPAGQTPKASPPPAKAEPAKTETPKAPEPKAGSEQAPSSEVAKAEPKALSADEIIASLDPSEIDALLARLAGPDDPSIAPLRATRVTKAQQVQYDGRTSGGIIVRLWAPEGTPMLTEVAITGPDTH